MIDKDEISRKIKSLDNLKKYVLTNYLDEVNLDVDIFLLEI